MAGKIKINNIEEFFHDNKEYELIEIKDRKVTYKHIECGTICCKPNNEFKRSPRCNNKECVRKFIKEENIRKYGKENVLQIESVKEKSRKTCLKKYGVEYSSQRNNFSEIRKQNCLEKYEVDNPMKLNITKLKMNNTKLKRYYPIEKINNLKNIEPFFSKKEFTGLGKNNKWKCQICENIFEDSFKNNHIPICPICFPTKRGTSIAENAIKNIMIFNKIEFNDNKRFYDNNKYKYELDIFIPSKNIGIELNGIYWHSEIHGRKNKSYHLNKTNYFNQLGIQILHFWDVEWNEKKEIVESIINNKLGLNQNKIYARKCEIKEVISKNSSAFLENNHLQGTCSSSIKLGLYHNNELVSLLTISKPRMNKNYDYEIARFCNKLNTSVIGGFSKLFNYFVKNYDFNNIITYADKRISNGGLYKNNGFTLLRESKPNYFYLHYNRKKLESRIKYQKHKLKELLPKYDASLSEWENMQLHGYDRIWDCGNYVFEYKKIE